MNLPSRPRSWLLAAGILCVPLAPVRAGPDAGVPVGGAVVDNARPPIARRRIVKHFDFNEAPLGNYEELPMFWRRNSGPGFPPFLEGHLDRGEGHAPGGAPSFRLDLNGGSLRYDYEGRDIAVRTNSDYLVVAWVRTRGLVNSRAYFSACYLNRTGERIAGTERTSSLVGGRGGATEWEAVKVALEGNVPQARYLGVSLWLTQPEIWHDKARPPRAIERQDVQASAWFDDLTVYRLPRVALTSVHPGNVFTEDETLELQTEVSDPDKVNLNTNLKIRSADGRIVSEQPVPIQGADTAPFNRVNLDDLPIGLYHAELTVTTEDAATLVRRSLRFARVARRFSAPADTGRGFGVILRDVSLPALTGQQQLLQQARTEFVKIPVWCAQEAVTGLAPTRPLIDQYLEAVASSHADPIAVMVDSRGPGPAGSTAAVQSMLDILSADPIAWKPLIASAWSRYAGLVHVWQLGGDGSPAVFLDYRLAQVLSGLRQEMAKLIARPMLATTSSLHYVPDPASKVDYHTITIPADIAPDGFAQHILPLLSKGPEQAWLVVETLPEREYERSIRLADLARRLAEAAYLHPSGVFLAAPWESQVDILAAQVSPTEDYIVFRTVADVLGGATPVSRTTIDGQAQCLLFDRNTNGILFAWDPYAPPEGREHSLLLGERAEQIDLWGRRERLPGIQGRQTVRIGPTPIFIVHTPTWLMEFRRRFRIEPAFFEASYEPCRREVVICNTYHEPITGLVRLIPPDDWDVRPNRIPFMLDAGQELRTPISIQFPNNAEAGITAILGEFNLDSDRRYQLLTPAWFELGLDGIDLDTSVYHSSGSTVVRVTMTNRTEGPANFDGSVIAPGRARLTRQFVSFRGGHSVTKDFTLENGGELAGCKVRVAFKEIDGPRLWNRTITIP